MNDKFTYDYTAPTQNERREIENIKRKYDGENREKSKLEELRYLDSKVKNPPTVLGLSFGIIGTLIFGLGLTMILEWKILTWGIVVMAIGCIPVALAYPLHNSLYEKRKNKFGKEIIRLSEELLNETEELK